MLLQAKLLQTDKQRLCTALVVGSGIQSHNATRSFSHSPYALLLLVVQNAECCAHEPKEYSCWST